MKARSPITAPTRAGAVQRLRATLLRRGWPRLQMIAIVALTGAAGLAASFLLHAGGTTSMALRYPLAVALAYGVFLLLLRLWLRWSEEERDALADFVSELPELRGDARDGAFHATDALDAGGADAAEAPGMLDALGVDEGLPLLLLLALLALAAALVFALVNVVLTAPTLFAELLFDGVLSLGLYRRLRRGDARHWLESAWRHTAWPFAVACASAALLGAALQWYAPGATTLSQAFGG